MGFRPRNGVSLCAGAGGLDMGLMLAEPDFHTRCFVEWEEYPRQSIIAAQRAGYFAPAPIWDDLTTFDATPLAGPIDTLLAGYPCQPFSSAGKRLGADDPRHLWPHVARVARELGDGLEWIFLENVAGHVSLGAETVLRELREMGFTPAAGLFSAQEVGAPHERLRWFCVAHRPRRGLGEFWDAPQPGRGRHADCGYEPVDDTICIGWDTGRDGHYGVNVRNQPRPECGAVADTAHGGGRLHEGRRETGSGAPNSGRPRGDVDNSAGARCDPTRIWPEADRKGGKCLLGSGCGDLAESAGERLPQRGQPGQPEATPQSGAGMVEQSERCGGSKLMADACGAGREGREQPGSPHQRNRAAAHGPTAERGGAWLFPPGPSDRAAWAAVMASSPDRAPAVARRDAATAALNIAAILTTEQAEVIEPITRGVDGIDELAALVGEAGGVVEQAQAITRIRNVAHGLAQRTRALRLLGNGVQPLAAAHAWRTLAAAHGLGVVDLGAADHPPRTRADEPVLKDGRHA